MVHCFQSRDEEYSDTTTVVGHTVLTAAAKKQGSGSGANTQLDTILLHSPMSPILEEPPIDPIRSYFSQLCVMLTGIASGVVEARRRRA